MALDELRDLAKSGTLSVGDLVRREHEEVWTPAQKISELSSILCGEVASSPRDTPSHPVRQVSARRAEAEPPPLVIVSRVTETAECESFESTSLTPRQSWSIGGATGLTMLLLFLVDHQITHWTPTFPQPRDVREQLAGQLWFLGSGPWSVWECGLLWIDALVIAFLVAWWVMPKVVNRERS